MGIQFTALANIDDHRSAVYVEGFDVKDEEIAPGAWINAYGWNTGNAVAMCALLGFADADYGLIDIHTARRAVMRARATFERRAPKKLARKEETRYGAPREAADGSIELRPIRSMALGLTPTDMLDKLTTFAAYVEAAATAGATALRWG